MNQFLSNKIISGIVAVALLVGVGVLISSGDTSSTTRNAALVVATPCTKPGQVTKVSKQSVVCATTNTGSLWYATMKAKGKAQPCTKPGAIRKKSNIVWVCGVIKSKKLWQATQPLPPAVVASTTVIETGATQPTPALDSTQVATPETPVVADNTVLADTKIPDDKIVTQVIDDATPASTLTVAPTTPATTLTVAPATTTLTTPTTPTVAPTTPTVAPTTPTVAPTTPTVAPTTTTTTTTTIPKTCATGGTCKVRDIGPGGGIVFYVATTPFTCGQDLNATPATTCTYLETAITNGTLPSTWTPTTKAQWGCYGTGVMTSAQRTASLSIGSGRANTKMITNNTCNVLTSAASIAATYNGGNKSDWFLPSRKELDALCSEFFKGRTGRDYSQDTCMGSGNSNAVSGTANGIAWTFAADYYWSSSEYNAFFAWGQDFSYGDHYGAKVGSAFYVRPVRAF